MTDALPDRDPGAEPARGNPERDDDAVARFVERFALNLSEAGMPRMPSRVLARLLADDDGQCTAGELSESLQVSPAAVSGAVRYLARVGLLVREREPGNRRDHYRVKDDAWYESIAQRDELLAQWENTIGEGIEAIGPNTPAGRRLEETRSFFAFLRAEMPAMLERWRARRYS